MAGITVTTNVRNRQRRNRFSGDSRGVTTKGEIGEVRAENEILWAVVSRSHLFHGSHEQECKGVSMVIKIATVKVSSHADHTRWPPKMV
jgi:hypothetical protein